MRKITIDDAIDRMTENFNNCVNLQCGGHTKELELLEGVAQAHFMAAQALIFCKHYGVDEKTLMREYLYDD